MEFNPDPTKQATEICFSCKKREINHPDLIFNGSLVERVREHKHLGIILEPNLSFEKHLHEKMSKAKKNIGIIKHLNRFLPIKTLILMYKALVRSHLDYCDVIYHLPSIIHPPPLGTSLHSLMEKVEKIQYQAALAVSGSWQGSSRAKLYDELGWESLSDRRTYRRLLQFHKIIDEKTPSYLREKLPPRRRNLINLQYVFQDISCRTNRYSYSFFPDAVYRWNRIISDFEHFPTFSELKKHLFSLYRPNSRFTFGIHDPLNLRHLFQLRVGLSHLRHHKKRHNFADTPSDICLCKGSVENTSHFLLYCPFYITHREKMITLVNNVLRDRNLSVIVNTELLLYGHASLSNSDNQNILSATLNYIRCTNRFSI